jgi:hypothetical protein
LTKKQVLSSHDIVLGPILAILRAYVLDIWGEREFDELKEKI